MNIAIADRHGMRMADPGPDMPATADAATAGLLATDDLLLYRLPLQAERAAERLEEARMRAIDLAAQPLEDLHVALGAPFADGSSWVAIIGRQQMAEHLAKFAAAGIEPEWLMPAALCLGGDTNTPAFARVGDQLLFRTDNLAGLIEPGIFHTLPDMPSVPDLARLPEFTPQIPATVPLDLLQGEFARRIRWWRDAKFRLGAAALLVLAALLLLPPPLWQQWQVRDAIARMDAEVLALNERNHLPATADATQAASQIATARKLREGAGLGPKLSFVAKAVEEAPDSYLDSVELAPNEDLQLQLGGPADSINRLSAQLRSGPFATSGHGADIHIQNRLEKIPDDRPALVQAQLRLANARRDTAILELLEGSASSASLSEAIAAAGLEDAQLVTGPTASQIEIPAARAQTLLPLIARISDAGHNITRLAIHRNADATVNARLDIQP